MNYKNNTISSNIETNYYNNENFLNQKRKIEYLSDNYKPNKYSKKQDVTKQYQSFKNMLSNITIQELPSTNIQILKNKNTYLVNLLFENRNLVRLIREKNRFLNDKNSEINFKEFKSKSHETISNTKTYSKNTEDKIKDILISSSMMYRDVFYNKSS